MKKNKNTYERVTERILALLEEGVCPWRRPWNQLDTRPQNYCTRRMYSGMNFFLLEVCGFELPYFMTYKQAGAMGGHVRKGEKGLPVIYWGKFEVDDEALPEGKTKRIPFLKGYTVFNASQIEGVAFPERAPLRQIDFEPILAAQEIVRSWADAPEIKHDRSRACYKRASDVVEMPNPDTFSRAEEYYSTLFHELAHATGAPKRLNREKGKSFGDAAYTKEELIAEMTSAFLCAECGIDNSVIENQSAYLEGWIKVIKGDSKLLVTAAAQAQKAANLIMSGQLKGEKEAA